MKQKNRQTEFLREVGYYITEVLGFIGVFIFAVISAFIVVLGPLFLAFGPMQYVSPWWGLVSIPGTIVLVALVLALWNRKTDY